jgi:hypothetical protein
LKLNTVRYSNAGKGRFSRIAHAVFIRILERDAVHNSGRIGRFAEIIP